MRGHHHQGAGGPARPGARAARAARAGSSGSARGPAACSARGRGRRGPPGAGAQAEGAQASRAEAFVAEGAAELAAGPSPSGTAGEEVRSLERAIAGVQADVDALYEGAFGVGEAAFTALGKARPQEAEALREAAAEDAAAWLAFQREAHELKLKRKGLEQKAQALEAAITQIASVGKAVASDKSSLPVPAEQSTVAAKIVLITGFESFNVALYRDVAREIGRRAPGVELTVFSDRDIAASRAAVEAALAEADVFFGSLLFDYDQVEWLKARVARIPLRLVFESALELMSETSVGTFEMKAAPGEKKGPPPAVKKVLSLFGSQKEEDKLVGYLSFLKIGPKLLGLVPEWLGGEKVKDLRAWLTTYAYWNQGGLDNVSSMFLNLVKEYFGDPGVEALPVIETPATGCLHPAHDGYFATPAEYAAWYERAGPLAGTGAPRVAVLLYRKHVITKQPYIPQLIAKMEREGLVPVPIFINGVEAHTVVRDLLTSPHEPAEARRDLKPGHAEVDAVVSTIGFPLVGGPAGTMEGGRQAEVAKAILASKNVPYVVAAPLLIQDLASWDRDGIQGLQSVVLYSLPELDGAIDTVPIGGLVGNDIFLVEERVTRLCARLRNWVALRRQPKAARKIAILLYGFPPGVGATGTAALFNVPRSLEALFAQLAADGYDVGADPGGIDGEAVVAALRALETDQRALVQGRAAFGDDLLDDGLRSRGVAVAAEEVSPAQLREWLEFPEAWGPSEWGPIPYLPPRDDLVAKMEAQWGTLGAQQPGVLGVTGDGAALVAGLRVGNVFVGVQPLLGVEGDPMRLLFERDLTPHPQYASFYKWLQNGFAADAVVHFGMHGTVEWLPGTPLGNSGLSWSDVLLGEMPNVYVYAANNPSESIVAKRRGYGTIVSHNVPPYGRAGLYKQLVVLRDLLSEFRDDPAGNAILRDAILENVALCGLGADCPFDPEDDGASAEDAPPAAFGAYVDRVYAYLQVLEGRLFSEGLHTLGAAPSPEQAGQYLGAYFGERLPDAAVAAAARGEAAEAVAAAALAAGPGEAGTAEATEAAEAATALAAEATEIAALLQRNGEEVGSMLTALEGGYVLPEAGGDLLRDGPGVLPTGRNIHALDPYRMPSPAAMERGARLAEAVLEQHRAATGTYPETVTVALWGLDAIKTRGESVAMLLAFVGARPVKEGTGRVARYEPVPLAELPGGRPRVDVLANMSGIFRDSFQNVVELLDDLFLRLAALDEPDEANFVRKHCREMEAQGVERAASRLFSNPAGDYGSMVNERVGAADWTDGAELGDTWASRNSFSYGRGGERGAARGDVLQALLATTDRVVQEVDSVEYGLTDIQEYYANTGALRSAAEAAKRKAGRTGGVGCSVVEAFGDEDARPRELEDVLRLEYRSKLLNPKWAEAMAQQGSGGAFEISQRMTALVGWGGTVGFQDDFVYDQAAEVYVQDEAMAERLRQSNPDAFRNVLKRFIEAAGRGLWDADEDLLADLRARYQAMDDQLEGL